MGSNALEIRSRPGRRLLNGLRPMLRRPVVLRLDDTGIAVRNSLDDGPDAWARLAWEDCVGVVVASAKIPQWPRADYVQFVAREESAIAGSADGDAVGGRALFCGLSRSTARLVWLELPGGRSSVPDVLSRVRERIPEALVTDSRT